VSGQILNERAQIDLEVGNFEANSKKVVALLNQIKTAANGANTGLGAAGSGAGAASNKFAALGKAMAQLRQSANGVTTATNTLGQRMTAMGGHLQTASAASQKNTQALNGNTHAITALAGHVATLQASVNSLTSATNANTAATQNAGRAAQGAASGFSGLGGVLAGLSFGVLAKEAIQLTDAYRSLETRLTVSSKGLASGAGAMRDVSRIAMETRSGLDAIGSLYSKVAMAGSHFGATQVEVARVTETVAKGLGVMGASAQETESTIIQLGQALASGRLQGDEFRSMTENAPALMEILAKATGKPRAELKKLATEGKLTSDVIISAFGSQSAAIKQLDADFAKMPLTVAQASTLFKNSLEQTLGTNEQMVGATKTLAATIQMLANNLNVILPVIALVSTAIGVGMVTNFVRARIAAGALGASLLGAFGGPIGIAVTALTIGIGALATQVYESNNLIDRLASSADNAAGKTQLTGLQALQAARGVSTFGGKAGEAAGKLWDMASAAKAAAIETAKLNLTKATADRVAAEDLTSDGFHRGLARENKVLRGEGYSFGDRTRAFGRKAGLIGRYIMAPNDRDVGKAVGVARQNENDARQTLTDLQTRPEEKYIPKIDAPVSAGGSKKKPGGGSKTDRVADFWKGLERERELAGMITPELEQHQKLFELQDALMDKLGKKYKGISAADEKRVADLLEQTRAAKLVVDIQEKTRALTSDTALNAKTLWMQANGETEGAIAKARALAEFEQEAIRQKINLNGSAYTAAMKAYSDQLDAADKLKLAEQGIAEVRASSPEFQRNEALNGFDRRRNAVNTAVDADGSTLTENDRRSALRKIDMDQRALENRFYDGMGEQISSIATLFGKRMGFAVDKIGKLFSAITKAASGDLSGFGPFGSLAKMLTTNRDGSMNKLGEGVSDSFNTMLGGIGRTLGIGNKKTDKVADAAQATADSTEEIVVTAKRLPDQLAGTLTSALVGAGIGGAMGGTAGSIGGALGGAAFKELFGKALGSFAGPIGGIVGGLAGSLIGGLFKKAPKGKAIITSGTDSTVSGNKSGVRNALSGSASSVQAGLADIASQLGGEVGNFMVSIGKYKDNYRVSGSGASNVDTKKSKKISNLIYDGKDESEAIAVAIRNAISDGAITGISDLADKAIRTLGADAAISLAQRFKSMTDDLDALTDPIGSAVRSINGDLDSLKKAMVGVGASSSDLALVEQARGKKLQALLEEELSPLKDFQKSLNTSEFGTPMAKQLETAKTAFEAMKADIAAGKTVDKDKFTSVASEYNSLGASLYGSAGPLYQAIKGDVSAVTTSLMGNITNAVGLNPSDPTIKAMDNQTATLSNILNTQVAATEKQTAVLQEFLDRYGSGFGYGFDYSGGGKSFNGRVAMY